MFWRDTIYAITLKCIVYCTSAVSTWTLTSTKLVRGTWADLSLKTASLLGIQDTGAGKSQLSTPLGSPMARASSVTEAAKRLQQTQMLLSQFSEANSRLATENDRLRAGRQILASDHADVLNEIDYLRSRLTRLETSANDVTSSNSLVSDVMRCCPDSVSYGFENPQVLTCTGTTAFVSTVCKWLYENPVHIKFYRNYFVFDMICA